MSVTRARLTRLPAPASLEDYARASAEMESRLRELPGIVAVYRTGSVSVPGISDLDRIAVVRPGSRVPAIWSELSAETRLLAMHGPFLVDTTTFARHRWFADLQPLELAWGDSLDIEARPAPEHIELLIAAESLVIAVLKLVKQAAAGRVKVRPTLCELNNLRRDLSLARLDRDDAPEAWSLADEVTRLREEWWNLPASQRSSRFRALLDQSLPATAKALRALSARSNGGGQNRHFRLHGVWDNVTLEAGDPVAAWKPGRLSPATARSTPLAEAVWRWSARTVAVPGSVISLLERSPGYEELRAERREILQRYVDFLATTKSYSGIGAAGVFTS
jgi:hypothetical protein